MKKLITLSAGAALAFAPIQATTDISHRKADLTVAVQSGSGTPLAGATVEIEMLNHAFRFGCAVEHDYIHPNSLDFDPFTVEQLQKYFNSTTYGNIMKWSYFEGNSEEENQAIAALPQTFKAFDGPDNLRLRGHVTVWGSEYQLPSQLKSKQNPSAETVHNLILDHVEAYHKTFKDSGIDNFDLYNEHFNVPQLLIDRIASPSDMAAQAAEVATWFNKAKEADPGAKLFINDFNILNDWSGADTQVKAYKAFIDAVRDAGGQMDGIGLQAHMDHASTSKADIVRRLDLLAAPMDSTENHPNGLPGLRIEITELDMSVKNEIHNASWVPWTNATMEEQVTLTDAVLTAAFEHPAVDGITIWGLDDLRHWRGNSIMFDNLAEGSTSENRIEQDPVLKETGQLYIDKVLGEWWEDHNGSSSPSGGYTANTFKGTHRVTVTFNGVSKEQVISLAADETVTFNFDAEAADAATYEDWQSFISWVEADDSRFADPDEDGRSNLHEFVFGTDPLVYDLPASPEIALSNDGENFIRYTVRARNEELTVVLKKSTDLVNWTEVQTSLSGVSVEQGLAHRTLQFPGSDLAPTSEEGSVFYRIEISEAN